MLVRSSTWYVLSTQGEGVWEGDLGELESCDRWEEEGEPRYPESGQLGGESLLS